MNTTTANCTQCGIELSELLLFDGMCSDCNLDHRTDRRHFNDI